VVQELPEGGVGVSIIDPKAMFQVVQGDAMEPIAQDAEARLRRVLEAL
jgi:hypothetical protein